MSLRALLGASALCIGMLAASPASAATVAFNTNLPTSTSAGAAPTSTTGTFFEDVTGSIGNVRRDPYEGTALADTGRYHSVSGGGSATYQFASDQFFLSLIWGSPDTFNTITFRDAGGNTIDTISAPPPPATQQEFANVTITNIAGSNAGFRSFVLSSSQNAFEYAQIVTPIPAAGLLLLSGLLGLGWLRRRSEALRGSGPVGGLSAA